MNFHNHTKDIKFGESFVSYLKKNVPEIYKKKFNLKLCNPNHKLINGAMGVMNGRNNIWIAVPTVYLPNYVIQYVKCNYICPTKLEFCICIFFHEYCHFVRLKDNKPSAKHYYCSSKHRITEERFCERYMVQMIRKLHICKKTYDGSMNSVKDGPIRWYWYDE